jgi:two-component system sensor histidine kinase HydH
VGELIPEPKEAWPFIDQALLGEAMVAPIGVGLEGAGRMAWIPLRNFEGRTAALLRLEARPSAAETGLLRTWVVLSGLVCTALLLAVGWLQYRTLRHVAQMEQAMAQEDRLRSLGTLAAGLAHELRNPLGILRGTAEEIGEEVAGNPELEALARDSIEEIDRLNDLIGHVLQFAKPAESVVAGEPVTCQVREVVEAVLHFVRKNMTSQQIELVPPEFQEDFVAAIDHNALRQVLLNLLFNAAEAIAAASGTGRIALKVEALRGDRLSIEIHDSGPGIPSEDLERVFDPFFSGKDQGAGLGLSISHGIVERAGGALQLESRPGEGTTARIMLKASKRAGGEQAE